MCDWHVWTLNRNRYKKAIYFLEAFDGIENVFYPLVNKRHGSTKKEVPLYANYIFIKYKDDDRITNRLLASPYFYNYVGKCTDFEIDRVKDLATKEYDEIVVNNNIAVGEHYKLKRTPFKGMLCRVVSVEGSKIVVAVELFGSDRFLKCTIDDILFEGTKL